MNGLSILFFLLVLFLIGVFAVGAILLFIGLLKKGESSASLPASGSIFSLVTRTAAKASISQKTNKGFAAPWVCYSALKLPTGFARPALTAWNPIVSNVIPIIATPAIRNTSTPIWIR